MNKRAIAILILLVVFWSFCLNLSKSYAYNVTNAFDKNAIIKAVADAKIIKNNQSVKMGIISHHLPTALPLIAEFYKNLAATNKKQKLFIIIGPDHFEKCRTKMSTTNLAYTTAFGQINIDSAGVEQLNNLGVKADNACFEGEHSIYVQAIFIKYFFPEALILPITLSSATKAGQIDKLVNFLKNQKTAVIIGSFDFSHYQNVELARKLDSESVVAIKKAEYNFFDLKHVDSPPGIKVILKLAKTKKLSPVIINQKNSFDYTGRGDNTTGYISAMFY
jgi:AmmeMemoRadiSam system protein B